MTAAGEPINCGLEVTDDRPMNGPALVTRLRAAGQALEACDPFAAGTLTGQWRSHAAAELAALEQLVARLKSAVAP